LFVAEQGHNKFQFYLNKINLVLKRIDDFPFDEIEKDTGPETKKIVEKHCRSKLENKSLDWLLRKYN